MTSLAEVALSYHNQGFHPVPLKAGTKIPVRKGVTGGAKKNLSVSSILKIEDGHNLAIRLPVGVVGLDWDAYKGAEAFEDLISLLGDLPETYRSTSRTDGKSGIYLYKTSASALPGEIRDCNVDIIKHTHRVAACYPSIHHTGSEYRWYYGAPQSGSVLLSDDTIPDVLDIPELPARWAHFLESMVSFRHTGGSLSVGYRSKAASFSAAVTEFAQMEEGNRNNVMKDLARQGMWYELGDRLEDGESLDLILAAAEENGLVADDGLSTVLYRIQFSRTWAEKHYNETKVGSPEGSAFDEQKIRDWNSAVQASNLSDQTKAAAEVLAARAITEQHMYLIMPTRALAAACGVSAMSASNYMRRLADGGWVNVRSGQGYEKGKKTRSNEVVFIFDNVPVSVTEVAVDLDSADAIEDYVTKSYKNEVVTAETATLVIGDFESDDLSEAEVETSLTITVPNISSLIPSERTSTHYEHNQGFLALIHQRIKEKERV